MKTWNNSALLIALLWLLWLPSCQSQTTEKVSDFRLLDNSGQSHQLSLSDSIWVLSPQTDYRENSEFERLAEELSEHADFFYIHEGLRQDWPSQVGVLVDPALVVTEQLGLMYREQVVVIKADGEILGRGGIQNLRAVLAGSGRLESAETGTPLFPVEPPPFSYQETVAPIMAQKCLPCHRDGQSAPFAFDQHSAVASRRSMIKEVILTGRMPPWGVNPHLSDLRHDKALSPLEKRAIISWIEQGASKDGEDDPLTRASDLATNNSLESPDLVLIPDEPVEVPAEGVLDYELIEFPSTFPHDLYITAMHFDPGDARAVHHANLLYNNTNEKLHTDSIAFLEKDLMGFDPTVYRPMDLAKETGVEDCGILLPKNSKLYLSLHLSTYGRATSFKPCLKLRVTALKPSRVVKPVNFLNSNIVIPANAARHVEKATHTLQKRSIIHGLFPHMHYRGWSARFEIEGERILQVPRYDFNWQHAYWLKEQRIYPAGTRVQLVGTFNNSESNPQNPDPTRRVPFGIQSDDEMLYGTLFLEELED